MQSSRRGDPYPFTWEIPAAVILAVVLVLVLGVHLGRAGANVLVGAGWTWPGGEALFTSVPGVVTGHAGAGLSHAPTVAASGLLWVSIAAAELVMVVLLGWALKAGLDRWGPHRLQGMATRGDAEKMLGQSRLRKVGPIIRPDLYGAKRAGR